MMPVPNVVTVAVFLSIGLLFNFASLLEDESMLIFIKLYQVSIDYFIN